jgi:uncharacterized protein YjiS (DUF1127 family)
MSNRLLLRLPMIEIETTLDRRSADGGLSWNNIRAAWRRYRSRQRISELDSHILKDIGVSFADAEAEANKPFWRA